MKTTIKLTVYQDSDGAPSETPIPVNRAVSICYEPKFDPMETIKEAHERAIDYLCDVFRAWLEEEFADRMSEAPITTIGDVLADMNRRLQHKAKEDKR